jgi:hypothetical protein
MSDPFKTHAISLSDPIQLAQTVTPSDTADLLATSRAIYVGSAGSIRVTLAGGETVTFSAASNGWHPIRATRIWATGTTAGNLVACS